ncbi:amino acid ABC transporter substrate-binding protein [Arsukibacterium ikkense]|uniref:Amino acid ABC transporter substrate-binding protein n=2 Tax=Arsukibacterium ikkense TaxID=336831 RepID=A0A0M2V6Y4_9GAMM|nr:amino acid ABC transporter substrate-binding protein [Arsukibacterium ikkense]
MSCKPVPQQAGQQLAMPPTDVGASLQQAKAQGAGELTVLYVAAEGFAYTNKQQQLTGVTVEIMRDFAAWLNASGQLAVSLNFVEETDWTRFYQRIVAADGGVFGLGNVTITEARAQQLQFSPAYLNNVAVLISHADIAELQNLEQLATSFAGMQPLAFSGTLHEVRIRALRDQYQPGIEIGRTGSNQQLLELVASGAWYSYVDAYNLWRAQQQGMPLRHHPVANDSGETFGIIMPLNNDWAGLMAEFFNAGQGYRNTERYQQILQQHLGAELTAILEQARLAQP